MTYHPMHIATSLLLALLCCALLPTPLVVLTGASPITIGAVLPISGAFSGSGFRAWLLLNQSIADLPLNLPAGVFTNQQFQLTVVDSGSSISGAMKAALTLRAQGCAVIMTGFEGMQNQNLTALSTKALNIVLNARAAGALTSSSQEAVIGGVSAAGTGLIDAVAQVTNAQPSKPPVIVPTGVGCLANTLARPENFVPLCVPPSGMASALAASFSSLGWTRFSIVSQDSIAGSWNSRYGTGAFFSDSGLGEEGGGASFLNQDSILADAIMAEIYGKTNSRVKDPDWPYPKLRSATRYRLPAIPLLLPAAISKALDSIQASRLFIIVVLLNGASLEEFLKHAYDRGMLGHESPYVWVGVGENSRRGGNIGIIEGTGEFLSRGIGSGLCSAAQAAKIQQYQNDVLSAKVAAGIITSTGAISVSSTVVTPTRNVDNPVVGFATSNPLLGAMCFVPATPSTTKWTNLRFRLLEGGLPSTTILDGQDGAVYDSVILLAHALDQLNKSDIAITGPAIAGRIKQLQNIAGLSSTWSFSADGSRLGAVDIVNFEQLASGALYHFLKRGTFDVLSGSLNYTDTPLIFSSGSPVLPLDFIQEFAEGSELSWSYDPVAIWLQLAMVLLATLNVGMYISKVRKWDPDTVEQRGRHYLALAKGALSYTSLVILGNVILGFIFFKIPSMTDDTMFHVALFWIVWIIGFILVFIGLAIAASQNGSKVPFFKSPRISRYEIAGKSGIAGGGGGSGVNFISSESSGNDDDHHHTANSHVSPIHFSPTGRTAPYGSMRSGYKKLPLGGQKRQTPVPWWSRLLEELYITSVLMLTSWRMLLGGVFLAAAHLIIFEVTMITRTLPSWVVETQRSEAGIGEAFFFYFLHTFGITILFREARKTKQLFGVLWLTGSNVGSFYTTMAGVHYTYETDGGRPIPNTTYWGPGDIALVLFILVAVALLSNLALVIDILQLSRGTLDQVLLSAKRNLSDLEEKLLVEKDRTKSAKGVAEYFRRILELINLIRPLHRNHALAFALAEVTDTIAAGGKKKHAVIPPCFDSNERPAITAAVPAAHSSHHRNDSKIVTAGANSRLHREGSGSKLPTHSPAGATLLTGPPPPPLPGSRQPSGVDSHPVGNAGAGTTVLGGGVSVGIPTGPAVSGSTPGVNSYEHLDFSFLARGKSELVGLKLLTELSERLFLATGPVHHRAVQDIHLTHILSHPVAIELFKDSLTRPQAQAHLACYLDIQRWKDLEGHEVRKMVAEQMVTTFLSGSGKDSSSSHSSSHTIHPIASILPATKDSIMRTLASSRSLPLPRSLFDKLEGELVYQLSKEMSSFSSSTSFKIVALILGHAAYQPDTRVAQVVRGRAVAPPSHMTGVVAPSAKLSVQGSGQGKDASSKNTVVGGNEISTVSDSNLRAPVTGVVQGGHTGSVIMHLPEEMHHSPLMPLRHLSSEEEFLRSPVLAVSVPSPSGGGGGTIVEMTSFSSSPLPSPPANQASSSPASLAADLVTSPSGSPPASGAEASQSSA